MIKGNLRKRQFILASSSVRREGWRHGSRQSAWYRQGQEAERLLYIKRAQNRNSKPEVERDYEFSTPTISGILPPAKPHAVNLSTTVPPTEDLVSMLTSGGHSYSNHHMESTHMGCIWKWQYNLLIKRDISNRPETETGKNKQKMRGSDVPEGTHQACRKDIREDIKVREASVLGCFSVDLVSPITRAT